MAIQVAEQKRKSSLGPIILFFALAVIGATTYYLFFKENEIEVHPADVTGGISSINLDAVDAVNKNLTNLGLQPYPALNAGTAEAHTGKLNPFQKF